MEKKVCIESSEKKSYVAPTLTCWGTVIDLTKTGLTNSGDDGKVGSVASRGA